MASFSTALAVATLNCGFSPPAGSPQTQIGGGECPKPSFPCHVLTSSRPSKSGALAGTSLLLQGQVFLNFVAL